MKRLHYPASNDEFDDACDLDMLLHPAQAFEHPSEVVNDHDLTLNEKRAILASWASDACAIEAVPTLRCLPGGKRPVPFDEVMDALRRLDEVVRRIGGTSQNRHALGGSRKTSSNEGPDDGRGHSLS
jgi:hypothetical protein